MDEKHSEISKPTTTSKPTECEEHNAVFEGAEKRLYILFGGDGDLRTIDKRTWTAILKHAKCSILHTMSNSECVAHLLSESSLFVFKHQLMVKTCGTTTLLHIIPILLQHCKRVHVHIENVFYSRSNFLFPSKQPIMHQKFEHEVLFLQRHFRGHGIEFGSDNNADWHCYTNNQAIAQRNHQHRQRTLEVVMFELDEQCMQRFMYGPQDTHCCDEQESNAVRERLDELMLSECGIPREAQIDSFVFRPCGYSLNAILDAFYWSIHITPEKGASFVSVESNYRYVNVQEVVAKIVRFFRPKEFSFAMNWYGVQQEYEHDDDDGDHGEKQAKFDEAKWKFESFKLTNCDLLTKFSQNHHILWANYAEQTQSARSDCILL